MNSTTFIDTAFSGRLCLTLLHSIWQVALIAIVAWLAEKLLRHRSTEWSYTISVVALLLALVALPVTYALVDVAGLAAGTHRHRSETGEVARNALRTEPETALTLGGDRVVTASYEDETGKKHGPGRIELGDINQPLKRTIYGDEPLSK